MGVPGQQQVAKQFCIVSEVRRPGDVENFVTLLCEQPYLFSIESVQKSIITIVTFIESRGKRMVSLLVGTTRCSLDNVTIYFLQCQLPSLPESVDTFTSKRTVPILYQFIILPFF